MIPRLSLVSVGGRRWVVIGIILAAVVCLQFALLAVQHTLSDPPLPLPGADISPLSLPGAEVSPDSDDAVFRELQTLLETVSASAPRCRRQHQMGGRCFFCTAAGEMVTGQVDGYKPLCLDWLPAHNCSALSFGINHDFSFDDQMSDLGCTVHAFDPTMGVTSHRRSERVHFHAEGVAAADGLLGTFPVVSLRTAASRAGLPPDGVLHYLKLDVEGSEWPLLETDSRDSWPVLRRTAQLALEFHLVTRTPQLATGVGIRHGEVDPRVTPDAARQFLAAARALTHAGFALTHSIHSIACQHYSAGCLPLLYETAWANTALVPASPRQMSGQR